MHCYDKACIHHLLIQQSFCYWSVNSSITSLGQWKGYNSLTHLEDGHHFGNYLVTILSWSLDNHLITSRELGSACGYQEVTIPRLEVLLGCRLTTSPEIGNPASLHRSLLL